MRKIKYRPHLPAEQNSAQAGTKTRRNKESQKQNARILETARKTRSSITGTLPYRNAGGRVRINTHQNENGLGDSPNLSYRCEAGYLLTVSSNLAGTS